MINEKDKSIKNLIQDLKNKEEKIISLNKDLISIKKDRDDQEKSFQIILKDLQFIQNGVNINVIKISIFI